MGFLSNNEKQINKVKSDHLQDDDMTHDKCSECGCKLGMFRYGIAGNYCSRQCASKAGTK
jgi:hypothetical protein